MLTSTNDIPTRSFDPEVLRQDFPILERKMNGYPMVFLDNAASSQKPESVIEAIAHYYQTTNANVHRGVYRLSQEATDAFERARPLAQRFLNAAKPEEIIYTRGATEGINLIASSFGRKYLTEGDEILITGMEHHSNIVPWQLVAEQTGAVLRVVPVLDDGSLDMEAFDHLLTEKTRIVSVVHVSNTLGTINPVKTIIEKAHALDVPVLVDGAQSVPHMAVDVRDLDADFFVFSGHKLFGPTGFGILYGKEQWLEALPPYHGGGEMIKTVTFEKTTYAELPHKFEAGTPNIAGAVGMAAAFDYLAGLDLETVSRYEHELLEYATQRLSEVEGLRIFGTAETKASVISFLVGDIHPYDLGAILDKLGVAVRTGHHCTQPLMDRYGIPGTVRASFAFYNNRHDIDRLAEAVQRGVKMLA